MKPADGEARRVGIVESVPFDHMIEMIDHPVRIAGPQSFLEQRDRRVSKQTGGMCVPGGRNRNCTGAQDNQVTRRGDGPEDIDRCVLGPAKRFWIWAKPLERRLISGRPRCQGRKRVHLAFLNDRRLRRRHLGNDEFAPIKHDGGCADVDPAIWTVTWAVTILFPDGRIGVGERPAQRGWNRLVRRGREAVLECPQRGGRDLTAPFGWLERFDRGKQLAAFDSARASRPEMQERPDVDRFAVGDREPDAAGGRDTHGKSLLREMRGDCAQPANVPATPETCIRA